MLWSECDTDLWHNLVKLDNLLLIGFAGSHVWWVGLSWEEEYRAEQDKWKDHNLYFR